MRTLNKLLIAALGILALSGASNAQNEPADPPQARPMDMSGSGPMLAVPQMDPARGRVLFVEKKCVVCHSVNGVGGQDAPSFDASDMPALMNPFEFTARMWRGAEAMVMLQQEELGGQIELTGQELADIIAFVHSHEEQAKFSQDDIPPQIEQLMAR